MMMDIDDYYVTPEERRHKLLQIRKWRKQKESEGMYTGENAFELINKTIDESDGDFAYSVLNLKVAELIKAATYSEAQKAAIQLSYTQLEKCLMSCKHISFQKLKGSVPSPLPTQNEKLLADRQFHPPVSISLCGSYVQGLAMSLAMEVDVRLVIPSKFFDSKDYLDMKWLVAKGYYAAVLAHRIKKRHPEWTVSYVSSQHNKLDLALSVAIPESVTFRVLLNIESTKFPTRRYKPTVNNIRPMCFGLEDLIDAEGKYPPSPLYNSVLAANQLYEESEQLLNEWINTSETIKHCMLLTKIWLRQLQLDQGFCALSNYILKLFMIYVLKNKTLGYHTTVHQTFTSFLQSIASTNWSQPMTLCDRVTAEELSNHKSVSDVVLIDASGFVNVCASVGHVFIEQLKYHASETVKLMLSDAELYFHDIFIKKKPHYMSYDISISINKVSKLTPADHVRYMDSCGDIVYSNLPSILDVLRKGLAARITALSVAPMLRQQVSAGASLFPSEVVNDRIVLGIMIDIDSALSTLERGPSADSPEAQAFREFWGDMSNLRRFMDGAICEAVVWNEENTGDKRKIVSRIAEYVLHKHCGIRQARVVCLGSQLDQRLMVDNYKVVRSLCTGEEELKSFHSTFNKLNQLLRAVKGLPLRITDIQGLDPAFRHSQVFLPLNDGHKNAALPYHPHRVMVVVEGDKWPVDDPVAISSIKMLMLMVIKEELRQTSNVVTLIREDAVTVAMEGHVFDVFLTNVGQIAHYRLNHETLEAAELFKFYSLLPLFTGSLNGIQSQHSIFGASARLLKRWVGTHMLSSFLVEPVSDLIMASVFINHQPYQVPRSPMIAFLRALYIIAHFDWANEPLVLNFNQKIPDEQLADAMESFKARRKEFPCVTIITPHDMQSLVSWPIAPYKMKLVREKALEAMNKADQLLTGADWSPKTVQAALFTAERSIMNVLIELKPVIDRRLHVSLGPESGRMTVLMDPADQLLTHIQKSYGDRAVVMYDSTDLRYIGLIWRPQCFKLTSIQTAIVPETVMSRALVYNGEEVNLEFDLDLMIQDITFCGQGIIDKITVSSGDE